MEFLGFIQTKMKLGVGGTEEGLLLYITIHLLNNTIKPFEL